MVAIKDKPTGLHDYYLNVRDEYNRIKEVANLENDKLIEEIKLKRDDILPYVNSFKLPIIDYPEF